MIIIIIIIIISIHFKFWIWNIKTKQLATFWMLFHPQTYSNLLSQLFVTHLGDALLFVFEIYGTIPVGFAILFILCCHLIEQPVPRDAKIRYTPIVVILAWAPIVTTPWMAWLHTDTTHFTTKLSLNILLLGAAARSILSMMGYMNQKVLVYFHSSLCVCVCVCLCVCVCVCVCQCVCMCACVL